MDRTASNMAYGSRIVDLLFVNFSRELKGAQLC